MRVDRLVALLLLCVRELAVWIGHTGQARWLDSIAYAALPAAVAVRRRYPLGAIALASVTLMHFKPETGPEGLAALIGGLMLCYGAAAFLPEGRARIGLLALLALWSTTALESGETLANLFFFDVVIVILPWTLGRMSRERAARERAHRERAERLDAEREQHALAAAWGERARLAREIHDVIAHSVSVMVIQSAGARTVMDTEPDRADAALRSVELAGREAMAEMRRLLGVLTGGAEQPQLVPQPGLDDIDQLVSRTRAAGLEATLLVEGEPTAVTPGLGLCAYRIVQEALTNAIKHAGPAHAGVCVRWHHDALEIEVSNDGRSAGPGNGAGGGHGIAGMRERAALHGGRVDAGPVRGGGFSVRAWIPLSEEVAA